MAEINPDKRSNRTPRMRRVVFALAAICALAFCFLAAFGIWYWRATQSPPTARNSRRELFEGVSYLRDVRRFPRPLVIHVVSIKVRAPGIAFLVTPPDSSGKLPLRARTTSAFCRQARAQIAINGDFFAPWHSRALWDYYPHRGDPVGAEGFAAARGHVYSQGLARSPVLLIDKSNQASFVRVPQAQKLAAKGKVFNALSGNAMLVENGQPLPAPRWYRDWGDLHPRVAIGLDRQKQTLILVVVDGRQAGYSEGVSISELAKILIEYGVHQALNLDGGGSATLAMESKNGKIIVLNSPIDNRIVGRERPVANHLAVFAQKKTRR